MLLVPGDWVEDIIMDRVGVIRSSNDNTSFVWFDKSSTTTLMPNGHLRFIPAPSILANYDNWDSLKYLAERRERVLQNAFSEQAMENFDEEGIRDEIKRLYGQGDEE